MTQIIEILYSPLGWALAALALVGAVAIWKSYRLNTKDFAEFKKQIDDVIEGGITWAKAAKRASVTTSKTYQEALIIVDKLSKHMGPRGKGLARIVSAIRVLLFKVFGK